MKYFWLRQFQILSYPVSHYFVDLKEVFKDVSQSFLSNQNSYCCRCGQSYITHPAGWVHGQHPAFWPLCSQIMQTLSPMPSQVWPSELQMVIALEVNLCFNGFVWMKYSIYASDWSLKAVPGSLNFLLFLWKLLSFVFSKNLLFPKVERNFPKLV